MRILSWLGLGLSKLYLIEVFAGKDSFWRSRIRHQNGEILYTSESYSNRAKALQTANNMGLEARFPVKVLE